MSKKAKNAETNPGREANRELEGAFAKINRSLFGGKLPTPKLDYCLRTDGGCFSKSKLQKSGHRVADKIQVNFFDLDLNKSAGQTEAFARLVHQMVHMWQFYFGEQQSRTTYHNEEWAAKIKSLGLLPTFDASRQKVSLEIDKYGKFYSLVKGSGQRKGLVKTNPLKWTEVSKNQNRRDQVKYKCDKCGVSLRGKSGIGDLVHSECGGTITETA